METEADNTAPVFFMTLEQWRKIYSMLGFARESLKCEFPEVFTHTDTQPNLDDADFKNMQNIVIPLKQKLEYLLDD